MTPSLAFRLETSLVRVNNARFLQRNFRRDYAYHEDPWGRYSTFELNERPLGERNRLRLEYSHGKSR